MKVISSIPSQVIQNIKNPKLKESVVTFAETKDVFEKSGALKTIAKEFRANVAKPFNDFNAKHVIPADKENGSALLKNLLEPFTKIAESFNKTEAERFVKLSIGEKQLDAITHGAKVNTDVKQFIDTLELNLGKDISKVVKG